VWALGAVLWETLAQRHLFKRETEFLTFQAITHDPIPDICELRPDVPPLLGDTIARAISRDREHRFATARALGEALAQAVGPLGGILGAGAIADEVERAFSGIMDEQRKLLEMARAGDTFDLERSNPLGGAATKLSTTPVSNIKGKLEAAQAEVAQYVRAQQAIRSLEDDEPSATGFTPPPGGGQGLYMRAPSERVRRSAPMPAEPPETIIEASPAGRAQGPASGIVRREPSAMPSVTAPVIVHASRLPWIVALVAVLVAGGVAVMFFMNKAAPAPAIAAAAGTTSEPAVVMNTTPPPSRVAAPPAAPPAAPINAAPVAVVPRDAERVATAAPPVAPVQKKHEPTKVLPKEPPVPAGPPGFITIDSTPVYAVIYIDGKKYGETPLVNISVPPGRHAVKAVSSSGTTRTLSITIESGKTAPVRRIEW
jgi:serine/threonine-protein kinase